MRSTVGLMATLLLLLGSSLATASYEKVIACGVYNETFPALSPNSPQEDVQVRLAMAKWSPDTSNFVPFYNYRFVDCSSESISWGCRSAYKDVSYGVDLNENTTLLTCVKNCGHFSRVGGRWESLGVKEPVEVKLFKCQDYIPAEEPEVPEGSWSDKLRVQYLEIGKSEAEWLNASTKECGQKPKNYVLGGQCGSDKYLEVVFVCDQPKRSSVSKEERDFLDANAAHLYELQFSLFRHFYTLTKHFQESKESQALQMYTKELSMAYAVASNAALNYSGKFSMNRISLLRFPDENSYSSRKFSSAYLKDYIVTSGALRSMSLFRVAIRLLTNNTSAGFSFGFGSGFFPLQQSTVSGNVIELKRWDVENADTIVLGPLQPLFPELKQPLTDLYVEHIKNHTFGIAREHLGFLGDSGAHTRLLSMYEEIFRPGFIDDKYMDKTPREGDFASLLANYLAAFKKVHKPLPPSVVF
uniref:C-type lectin domain-containing protein n=1 Tax=Steinernema glaseri TaxID=37863 RepID=A0A1I7Y5A3_9BILA